jgi:hypothetical protein
MTAMPATPTVPIAQAPSLEARRVEVREGYAMVEVWRHEPHTAWLPTPYRQTLFYQETELGWLPTPPPDIFWLPLDTLQTGRLTFVYGRRDASSVQETARQVEAVAVELRAELGLPPTGEALTIRVINEPLTSHDPAVLAYLSRFATLVVPSPALLALPAHISEEDALLQLVKGLLMKRILDEALAGSSQECIWRGLARGLYLWLVWEHSELPSQTRHEMESLLEFNLAHNMLPYLTWVNPNRNACSLGDDVRNLASSYTNDDIAPIFVEYAVSAYGRERLPALLGGMHHYATWETLIPAVYGISAAEFEAGWRNYVKAQYGGVP